MLKRVKKETGSNQKLFVMEATSTYYVGCAYSLHNKGEKVAVVNPRFTRNFREAMGQANKTDVTDAQIIAHYDEVKELHCWQPPVVILYLRIVWVP